MSTEGRRQAPDGAPAATGPRAEVMAAARNRSGLLTQVSICVPHCLPSYSLFIKLAHVILDRALASIGTLVLSCPTRSGQIEMEK